MPTVTPNSIIQAVRVPAKYDGCVPTKSGLSFDILDPKAKHVRLEDVIQGISYKFRFGGQLGPITVAEHSMLVADIIETLWPESGAALAGLLHDGCEAYTHDIQSPVRKFLKIQMRDGTFITWGDMERRINLAISKALGLGNDFYTHPEVQAADIIALAIEKAACPTIAGEKWGLPPIPPEVQHLKVQFLSPSTAAIMFQAHFTTLTQKG